MARKIARNYDLTCVGCGIEFKGLRPSDKFCTQSCRWRYKDKQPVRNQQKKDNHKKWRDANVKNRRAYQLMYSFGITPEQYEELLESQGGGCAICGKTPEEEGRNLAVDHDHGTGEIFGILCLVCNRALVGKIRVPEAFESAAKYLRKGTGWYVPERKKRSRKTRRPRVKKTS